MFCNNGYFFSNRILREVYELSIRECMIEQRITTQRSKFTSAGIFSHLKDMLLLYCLYLCLQKVIVVAIIRQLLQVK